MSSNEFLWRSDGLSPSFACNGACSRAFVPCCGGGWQTAARLPSSWEFTTKVGTREMELRIQAVTVLEAVSQPDSDSRELLFLGLFGGR